MQLSPSGISGLTEIRIKDLRVGADAENTDAVISAADGICRIHGLSGMMQGEILELPGNTSGLTLDLERDSVGTTTLGEYEHIPEDGEVKCIGRILGVPVGPELLGRVVNILGQPIDDKGLINTKKTDVIEKVAPGVIAYQSVSQPVQTGLKSIDAMVPIGRGQRELVIGNRRTGKTAIAVDVIINQKDRGIFCVYATVGQKASTVVNVVRELEGYDTLKYVIVVATVASDSATIQHLSAYVGYTVGECFRDRGEDALIVCNDLTR